MFYSAIAMMVGLFFWGWVPSVIFLLIILLPVAFGGGVLNTVLNSVLSKSVMPEEVGGTLGLGASVESLTRVIAPALGGILLAQFGPWGPAIFCTVLMIWVASFIWRRFIANPDPPLNHPEQSVTA
jgi:DHA1 family tetracycline resistance protein-like MFS transporter